MYVAANTLHAIGFDLTRLDVRGDPIPVVEQVTTLATGAADFRISQRGTLIYVPGTGVTGAQRSLVWATREGHETPISAPPRGYQAVRLSPDGTRADLTIAEPTPDIWVWDFSRQNLQKLTFGNFSNPVWSPDGRRIVFRKGAADGLFWQAADGTGVMQQLSSTGQDTRTPFSFSPDGHDLVVTETNPKTLADVLRLHLNGSSEAEPLLHTAANETWGEISPVGHWMAYYSDESGRGEVYVRPYPKVDGGRWLISTDGGTRPVWSRNGRELFYTDYNSAMMVATVQTSPVFSACKPIKLFDQTIATLGAGTPTYDVSPDGRFLLIKPGPVSDRNPSPTITVVVNWTEELKQRVPTK